jgi:hypothetical protein
MLDPIIARPSGAIGFLVGLSALLKISYSRQPMRILVHVTTFNDAEVIDQALDAIRQQTRPPDGDLLRCPRFVHI